MFFGKKALAEWVEKGLLSPEQHHSILTYEASKQTKSSWGLYGISFIGVATIAIGLISVVAGNWDQISPSLKLIVYLLLQSTLGFLVFKRLPKLGVFREAAIVLFSLTFLAGMGLTAQVFHIESNGWSALAFWCALTLPVTVLARKRFMPYLWTLALMATFTILAVKNIEHQSIGRIDSANAVLVVFYLMFGLGIVRIDRFALPDLLGEAFRAWTFLGLVAGSSTLGTAIWYAGHSRIYGSRADAVAMKIIANFQLSVWLGSLLAILGIVVSKPSMPKKIVLPLCISLVLLAAFPTMPLYFDFGESRLIGTIFLIITWWSLAVLAIQLGWKRTFDFMTLAITIRVLVVYFEVFGDMLQTGVGLIVSGTVILGLAAAWYKSRDRLAKWMGVA
jgi:uncharacterized membrane protein